MALRDACFSPVPGSRVIAPALDRLASALLARTPSPYLILMRLRRFPIWPRVAVSGPLTPVMSGDAHCDISRGDEHVWPRAWDPASSIVRPSNMNIVHVVYHDCEHCSIAWLISPASCERFFADADFG